MEIKIEKDVSIPGAKPKRGSLSEVIRNMSPGESFAVPNEKANSVRAIFNYIKLKNGLPFVTRKEDGDKTRFWRTA